MTFEFDGKRYGKAATHQTEWGARLIAELDLKGDEHILDLGCGNGAVTAQLADLTPEGMVVGIDASRGMIEAANQHERPNLSFRLLDMTAMTFRDEFHLVFSNAALHWVRDHRTLLTGIFESLINGGGARLNFAGDGNCAHFFAVIRRMMTEPAYAPYFQDFQWPWYMPGVDEYRGLLGKIPFAKADVWGENADRYFPDADAMIQWIDQPSLVPFLARVDHNDKQRFRDTVVERMIADTRQPDGTCFETFRRINVLARK